MKYSIAAVTAIVLSAGIVADNALAGHNGGNSGSSASAPAQSRGGSAPTTAMPHLNSSMPHFSGMNSYRPAVNYQGGMRTLNYPAVRNSTLRQQPIRSNLSGLNSGYALQHNGNSLLRSQTRSRNGLNNTSALQGTGNLRRGSGLQTLANHPLDPQTSARLRNWNGNVSSAAQARSNHLNNCNHHHDHGWWRNHCLAFIFFDFGWWGWYDGWWYPAWGYDPYSYYEYNEPIYGSDGLSPEQIVASVQAALQERGYYQYAIDGRMGPLTRAAIARYQRDRGLPITSGIDPATLGSLGVVR
jgi:Putative peptidoglycan binding domain